MSFRKITTIFVFLLLVVNPALLNAANVGEKKMRSRNPYLITNIFSSAEESAPSDSRAKAMIKANRIAFLVLLGNLGIDESFAQKVNDSTIEEAVYSRQINDEVVSGNYYSAKFSIAFLKSTISGILEGDTTKYQPKSREESFLFIPIQVENNREILWERNNLWRKSLEQSINVANSKNIILPIGDYNDIVNISLRNIKSNNFNDFVPAINRYGADSVVIAYFEIDEIENKANVTLNFIRNLENKRVKLSFVNSKNLSKNGLLLEVADRTIRHISQNEDLKSKKPVQDINPGKISNKALINIEIVSLSDWMNIEAKIKKLPFIKNMLLQSITRDSAKLLVEYDSDGSDLTALFMGYNLPLKKGRNGDYILSK